MGTCAHCKREWYSKHEGKETQPKYIPTCPEGEIMAICVECFNTLPSAEIIALVQAQEKAGRVYDNIPSFDPGVEDVFMTPTEYRLVESAIAGWVKYMKGEAGDPPFEQEAIAL
ncbi:MAG: hypothetical protein A3C93_00070 [Candidatus Lloydbacteria bacterium RIFCSPHIGHO2_02_FULL_54_17]|uniref:Uncharacterized protein n=1 Tax=Candidatus Lloydbacteria bacterium RIFCSPHIGHO2_02_FULL_54_17 TaxID=1798664 RepID=A0A1G2DI72_9BACT|nr:MAG: hypothetical protein A2762_03820 [Candidatus Lloydbacteria bacterium RIFCSPHIGHO2_01_FULL_54_11]OGZ13299.1 MAG: hypothetical protein A3C93_00070 [Candidatus Lloydbacteria bacterium RIFCSPHIGHO2_02_FULL_54_17]OGZ17107.1 MAG: hypothetical protein A3H76_02870 [Candidatus Lloydbacteria bacterium RIFCSPLOWO2_02_FULL_54_12]